MWVHPTFTQPQAFCLLARAQNVTSVVFAYASGAGAGQLRTYGEPAGCHTRACLVHQAAHMCMRQVLAFCMPECAWHCLILP